MIRVLSTIIFFSNLLVLLTRCAQITPLTGGARDTTPPKLLVATPEIKTTSFSANEILLQFDEYVQVRDIQNQILISPTLKNIPEIESLGKKLRIKLKTEDLLPNTTYRFTFGKSIADMHEGNVLENFEYIFSTGSTIDSLRLTGKVINAFNHQPENTITVGLFPLGAPDSSIYFKKPLYTAKTDAAGNYSLKYIAPKSYKLVAVADKNNNGIYDGATERIGFYKNELQLYKDTALNMDVFQEEPSKTYLLKTISGEYGTSLLIFSKPLASEKIKPREPKNTSLVFIPKTINDTISVFYKNISDSLWLRFTDENTTDTVKLVLPKQKWSNSKQLSLKSNLLNGTLKVGEQLTLETNTWLDSTKINTKAFRLTTSGDSFPEKAALKYIAPNQIVFTNTIKEGFTYKLKSDSATLVDYFGNYNDSINISLRSQSKAELGNLILKTTFTTKNKHLVQLVNESGAVIKEISVTPALAETNVKRLEFTNIPPGQYSVKIIFDSNENNKWDTGNYIKQQSAERIKILDKRIKVMSDWEVEEEIFVKE
jgi:hypothetical protein